MDTIETSSDNQIDPQDFSINNNNNNNNQQISDDLRNSQLENAILIAELEALRASYQSLQSKSTAMEETTVLLHRQKDEATTHNTDLIKTIEGLTTERDSLSDELRGLEASSRDREDELVKEKGELQNEVEVSRNRIEELMDEKREKVRVWSETLGSIKECLVTIIETLDEEKEGNVNDVECECERMREEDLELDEESRLFSTELTGISKLASKVESKLIQYRETRKKEKKELENSVVSLTEENRDINSLLRIALVEKEAVEKSLNRLKGNSNEQKRVAILQIAERGLQRVGFGFMMGTASNEALSDNSGSNTCSKSDSSECEEEVVSLASTVEKIMKNLRLEITQLRRSLEESRSDTERLQSLTEKQAQKIAECTLYIKELEDRETLLAQNVEELLMEIKETEEEVARWREACELEVEAGKNVVEERDKVAAILKQELEKMKAALDISNSKLKLKEELAIAAMAAQAAAETSLQLADSRAAGLRERIEELTRQVEEAESRERGSRRKVRHICWPWRALKVNPANTTTRVRNVRRMLPEMQALLPHTI